MSKETIKLFVKPEAEINRKFSVELHVREDLGRGKILFNRHGEQPSKIVDMESNTILMIKEEKLIRYYAETTFEELGNYYFFFLFEKDGVKKAIKIDRNNNKPSIMKPETESPYWRVLVTNQDMKIPEWAADRIAYHIFVDRFNKSERAGSGKEPKRNYRKWGEMPNWKPDEKGIFHNNDFFGGNIKGITEKMDYFKSLSVGILYLSPINESLYRYERYASTNHMEIDPDAGTFDDLKELHYVARKNDIYIILDIAFNHCSSDNPIFQDALKNPESKYRDWFFINEDGTYECWYGFTDMPVFNQFNPEFQNYVYGPRGVVAKFAPYVDGFRLDLAESLQPFFLEGIRKRTRQYGPYLILGEWWTQTPIEVLGKGIDCPTNYVLTDPILHYIKNGEAEYLEKQLMRVLDNYPQATIDTMFNSLDTHDMMRSITILSDKQTRERPKRIWAIDEPPTPWHVKKDGVDTFLTYEFRKYEFENDKLSEEAYLNSIRLLELAIVLQFMLPGNPCIYYGTEVGLYGYKDPFNRKCYPWGNEDKELLKFYQEISDFRKNCILKNSTFKIHQLDEEIFSFERKNEHNSVFVILNRTSKIKVVDIPEEIPERYKISGMTNKIYLLPYSSKIIRTN